MRQVRGGSLRGQVSTRGDQPPSIEQTLRALVVGVVREELELMKRATPDGGEYMKVAEAAEHARVVPATIRKWIREGKLARHSAGADPRIRRSDLERLLRTPDKPSQLTPEQRARRDFG